MNKKTVQNPLYKLLLVLAWRRCLEDHPGEWIEPDWSAGGRFEPDLIERAFGLGYIKRRPRSFCWLPEDWTRYLYDRWVKRNTPDMAKVERYFALSKTATNAKLFLKTRIGAGKKAQEIFVSLNDPTRRYTYYLARKYKWPMHHDFWIGGVQGKVYG